MPSLLPVPYFVPMAPLPYFTEWTLDTNILDRDQKVPEDRQIELGAAVGARLKAEGNLRGSQPATTHGVLRFVHVLSCIQGNDCARAWRCRPGRAPRR